jgi:hypothetical protein
MFGHTLGKAAHDCGAFRVAHTGPIHHFFNAAPTAFTKGAAIIYFASFDARRLNGHDAIPISTGKKKVDERRLSG